MRIALAAVYTVSLMAIALEMYRSWRQSRKIREFRDFIKRTYGNENRNDEETR